MRMSKAIGVIATRQGSSISWPATTTIPIRTGHRGRTWLPTRTAPIRGRVTYRRPGGKPPGTATIISQASRRRGLLGHPDPHEEPGLVEESRSTTPISPGTPANAPARGYQRRRRLTRWRSREPAPAECRADWPVAYRRPRWRALTATELEACRPTVTLHVHLTDQTLRDNHGVVRTDAGPILLEQLHRYLVQHDAKIKVYPIIDPADTASADSYEIPLRLRRAMAIRHPRSVFPHSPTTSGWIWTTLRLQQNGPPGQTGMHSLGPLARGEHRPKTVGQWRSNSPNPAPTCGEHPKAGSRSPPTKHPRARPPDWPHPLEQRS